MKRRKVFPFLLALLLLSVAFNGQAADLAFTGRVVGVSDGDTLSLLRDGRAVKVRLHGIDCPEKGQPFGAAAKKFTSDAAFGKEVTVQPKAKDRYGRTVAEIMLPDGTSLNQQLVSNGLAWWYRKYAPSSCKAWKQKPEPHKQASGHKKTHPTMGMETKETQQNKDPRGPRLGE